MWNRLVLYAVLGGCGFQSTATPGGTLDGGPGRDSGGSGDGSDGGPVDGSSGADCLGQWLGGSVAISATTVAEVTELSTTGIGNDRNPWVSSDGLRMYFSRDQGTTTSSDIFFASRASAIEPFGPPGPVANLNGSGHEGRVWLTPDELTLTISSERNAPQIDIQMIQRNAGDSFGSPDRTHLTMVNSVGTTRNDPFLSADGLRLYLSSNSGPAGRLQLLLATRSSTTADFGRPDLAPGIQDNGGNMADPTLYQDERVLVFSAFPPGSGNADLWYATRSSATGAFGAPIPIPGVNTAGIELDPVLGGDGCELYFASNRRAGKLHLFRAQLTR